MTTTVALYLDDQNPALRNLIYDLAHHKISIMSPKHGDGSVAKTGMRLEIVR